MKTATVLGNYEPCIKRIWIYGSALKSGFKKFRDIDFAIENDNTDDQNGMAAFIEEEKKWEYILQRQLPGYTFHLYPYDTKIVQDAILLYDRSINQ